MATNIPSVNGLESSPEQQKFSSDEEESIRKHSSTSVSRTRSNSKWTPSLSEQGEMEGIKQKIDFTDPYTRPSLLNTPTGRGVISSAPPSLNGRNSKERTSVSSNDHPFVQRDDDDDETLNIKTSVGAIISRLETVRKYIEDARGLYEQLQEHFNEPGTKEHMERVSVLINQLKQQELSYLQVLLKIMEDEDVEPEQVGEVERLLGQKEEDSSEEEEEEEDIEGLSLTNEVIKNNDDIVEQEKALHEQQSLLKRLLEQQKQLETLKTRQTRLLALKKEAEIRLAEAEMERKELDETVGISQEMSQGYMKENEHEDEHEDEHEHEDKHEQEDEHEDEVSERERVLLAELQDMKQKKLQVEKLLTELNAIKTTQNSSKYSPEVSSSGMGKPVHEYVGDNSQLYELKSKMKQVEEAREKMKDLQAMVNMLQDMTVNPNHKPQSTLRSVDTEPRNTEMKKQPSSSQKERHGYHSIPPTTIKDQDTDDSSEVIQLLAEYERNIKQKQKDVEKVHKQREEIKEVERMLHDLQLLTEEAKQKVTDDTKQEEDEKDEVPRDVSTRLEVELNKQRQLYEDLMRKTYQLHQLQQEIEKISKGSDLESGMVDTTAATWGGSSVVSDSEITPTPLNDTQDSIEQLPNFPSNPNGPHLPQYHVDRHTPRQPRPLRRAYSPHDDHDTTIGKKIKLEPQTSEGTQNNTPNKKVQLPSQPVVSTSKKSAVWPTVIFSQNTKHPSGKIHTPPSLRRPGQHQTNLPSQPRIEMTTPTEYTQLLQHQLANSSAMCFQLLDHQTTLLQALHQKLDTLPHVHEQMMQLHMYHEHLQGYHEYLNNVYWQLMEYGRGTNPPNEDQEEQGNQTEELLTEQQGTFQDGSILEPPPPVPLVTLFGSVNSPFQRPVNPHLLTSPNKLHRPLSRPGNPYSLFGQHGPQNSSTFIPEVINDQTEEPLTQDQETQCTDNVERVVESTSSLPDKSLPSTKEESPGDFSVFDSLRDTIYAEVASLIASNEARPHFLVELFRELQLLNTDYLRQRALYSIQDLITRFLTDQDVEEGTVNDSKWTGGNDMEENESLLTSEDDQTTGIPLKNNRGNSERFDYTEAVDSASSISTPPVHDEPFASENLGDTVVKVKKNVKDVSSDSVINELDTNLLDEEIKIIMTEVIPLLKQHLSEECTQDLLSHIQHCILNLVLLKEDTQDNGELGEVFTKQLETSLNAAISKFQGQILRDCGEDLLVDVSEVLFNEIGFYRLLKDTQGASGKEYYKNVTSGSQTTTDIESLTASPQRPIINAVTLQALGSVISKSLQEEEESLGKTRDDELAKTWQSNEQEEVEDKVTSHSTPVPDSEIPPDPIITHNNQLDKEQVQQTEHDTGISQDEQVTQ